MATAQGRVQLALSLGFSGKDRDATRIALQREGAGAAPSPLALGFGGGQSELLLGGRNSLPPLGPAQSCFCRGGPASLLMRADTALIITNQPH